MLKYERLSRVGVGVGCVTLCARGMHVKQTVSVRA